MYHFKFLQDPEPEMKSIACLRIEDLADIIDIEDIVNKLIPILKNIQTDQNQFVRSNLFMNDNNRFSCKYIISFGNSTWKKRKQ